MKMLLNRQCKPSDGMSDGDLLLITWWWWWQWEGVTSLLTTRPGSVTTECCHDHQWSYPRSQSWRLCSLLDPSAEHCTWAGHWLRLQLQLTHHTALTSSHQRQNLSNKISVTEWCKALSQSPFLSTGINYEGSTCAKGWDNREIIIDRRWKVCSILAELSKSSFKSSFKSLHIGAERPNNFKEVSGVQLYGKMTKWYHWSRNYVSPNQSCLVLGVVHKYCVLNIKELHDLFVGMCHVSRGTTGCPKKKWD